MYNYRKFAKCNRGLSDVVGVIIVIAIVAAVSSALYVYMTVFADEGSYDKIEIYFSPDNIEDTLTVTSVSQNDLIWSKMQETSTGTCTIPSSGTITPGNIISNCEGTITLVYDNITYLGTWIFT